MKQARIKCRDRRFPFGLKVSVDHRGVRFERTDDTPDGKPFLVLNSTVKSARLLATWILDNTEEEA